MPTKSKKKPQGDKTEPKKLSERIEAEIKRLSVKLGCSESVLKDFAQFVLEKDPITPPLAELKTMVYKHFQVKDTTELKKSGSFKMATSGMGKIDLSKKAGWEAIYRKTIGLLPGEENEKGYGCINGINIFKYDLAWDVFGLDPQVATTEDVKAAYHSLSKIYHPDNSETGDASIFARLTVFYKGLTEKF